MLIVPEPPEPGYREHPWGRAEHGDGAYYDFARSPELIPTVLEDFLPHAHHQAVQRFFKFLRWVAISPDSVLETNDCAFRGPSEHGDTMFPPRLVAHGRLHIFYRHHAYNVRSDCFRWLERMFCVYLQVYRPDFRKAIIGVSAYDTTYTLLSGNDRNGKLLNLGFRAYGDTETDVFNSLLIVFDGFWEASKRMSGWMITKVPDLP